MTGLKQLVIPEPAAARDGLIKFWARILMDSLELFRIYLKVVNGLWALDLFRNLVELKIIIIYTDNRDDERKPKIAMSENKIHEKRIPRVLHPKALKSSLTLTSFISLIYSPCMPKHKFFSASPTLRIHEWKS